MAHFFVSTFLGAEDELAEEIREIWPFLVAADGASNIESLQIISVAKGGVEIQCSEILGLQLNFHLRLASRILLRLFDFRATEFHQLKGAMKKSPVLQYLNQDQVSFRIASEKSKLGQEKRIAETCLEAFSLSTESSGPPTLFLRGEHDHFQLSLDTSGDHLHQRGYRKTVGVAPVRETLACLGLRLMMKDRALSERLQIEWLDPFCGSGTFLTEAWNYWQPLLERSYAFERWKKQFAWLKNSDWRKHISMNHVERLRPLSLQGCDLSPEALEVAKQNATRIAAPILWSLGNSLESQTLFDRQAGIAQSPSERWMIMNPPYGLRIESSIQWNDLILFLNSMKRIGVVRAMILWPWEKIKSQSKDYPPKALYGPYSNGGLSVGYALFDL